MGGFIENGGEKKSSFFGAFERVHFLSSKEIKGFRLVRVLSITSIEPLGEQGFLIPDSLRGLGK